MASITATARNSFKPLLMASTMLIAASTAGAAFAAPDDTPGSPPTSVGELVITGTRLKLPDYTAPSPVETVSGQELQDRGVTNITDFLRTIPALENPLKSEDFANAGDRGYVGLNELNLRNLGTQRTLVLVDGIRHVAGDTLSQAVDINSIPISLIDRVDVLTGGVSAVYGADAVSGVVNFILKTNFDGVNARAQMGGATEGGGQNQFFSVLMGKNYAQDRGNITLAVEAENTQGVNTNQRSYLNPQNALSLVDDPTGKYTKAFLPNVRYKDSAEEGAVYTNFDTAPSYSGVSFLGTGAPWVDGVDGGSDYMIGGSGTLAGRYREQALPPIQRIVLDSTGHFDFTPKIRVFTDFKFAHTETTLISQPSFNYGIFVPIDNPYIPASILADALAPGGLGTQAGANAAQLPDDGTGTGNSVRGVLVGRDNFDLGNVLEDISRNTYRGVVGAKGSITDYLDYEISGELGETKTVDVERNNRIEERFYAAADVVRDPVTGNIVCRSNLNPSDAPVGDIIFGESPIPDFGATFTPGPNSGCIPINIFGAGPNNISQAAANWINTTSVSHGTITQADLNAHISGQSTPWFSLPAGPIAYVLGGEYRREGSDYFVSDIQKQAAADQFNISFLGAGADSTGHYYVGEAYTELQFPILKDMRFAKSLSVSGAYRYSDYSTSGSTNTYNVSTEWAVNNTLMFRGTVAKAVRAPNLSELFQPTVQTYGSIADPCDKDAQGLGKPPREANCAANLLAAGYTATVPTQFTDTNSSGVAGTLTGNPNLQPETSHTLTYGVVFTPSFVPRLSISLDYYRIKLTDAIEDYTAQEIADQCVDLPQPNQFCNYITRYTPATAHQASDVGLISAFTQTGFNIAGYKTDGFDLTVRYGLHPSDFGIKRDIGTFNITLIANKLEQSIFTEDVTQPDNRLGDADYPEWQGTLNIAWHYNNWTVDYGYTATSRTRRFDRDVRKNDATYVAPNLFDYPGVNLSDLQIRYDNSKKWAVFVGANNLFNQQPAIADPEPSEPVSPLGRFFYAGVEKTF
jgi:iron complex outermembrane receptor protein